MTAPHAQRLAAAAGGVLGLLVAMAIPASAPACLQPVQGRNAISIGNDKFVAPFDGKIDARAELERAKIAAREYDQRVLLIFGSVTEKESAQLAELLDTPDLLKLQGLEYQVVWAEIASGPKSDANMKLLNDFKQTMKLGDLAVFVITEADGTLVTAASTRTMLEPPKESKRDKYAILKIQDFLTEHRSPAQSADQIIAQAVQRAKASGQAAVGGGVLAVFVEHGERWSDRFETWVRSGAVKQVLDKHVTLCVIQLAKAGGAWDKLQGLFPNAATLPLYAMLDTSGRPLALSEPAKPASDASGKGTSTPDSSNIGMPTDAREIDRFIALIRTGAPKLSPEDEQILRTSLQTKPSSGKQPSSGNK